MSKKKADPKASPNKSPHTNSTRFGTKRTSAKAQICLLTAALKQRSGTGVNRFEVEILGITHLAGRICDLTKWGCKFTRRNEVAVDSYGVPHKGIRRYWLTFVPQHLHQAIQGSDVKATVSRKRSRRLAQIKEVTP